MPKLIRQIMSKIPIVLVTALIASFATHYYDIHGKTIIEAAIPRSVWSTLSSDDKSSFMRNLVFYGRSRAIGKVDLVVKEIEPGFVFIVTGKMKRYKSSQPLPELPLPQFEKPDKEDSGEDIMKRPENQKM